MALHTKWVFSGIHFLKGVLPYPEYILVKLSRQPSRNHYFKKAHHPSNPHSVNSSGELAFEKLLILVNQI